MHRQDSQSWKFSLLLLSFSYWQLILPAKVTDTGLFCLIFTTNLGMVEGNELRISSPHRQHFRVLCVLWDFVILFPYSNPCMARHWCIVTLNLISCKFYKHAIFSFQVSHKAVYKCRPNKDSHGTILASPQFNIFCYHYTFFLIKLLLQSISSNTATLPRRAFSNGC